MAELTTINLALYAQTDVGMVRSGNEDNFLILDLSSGKSWTASEEEPPDLLTYSQGYYGTLLAVSDGMGGALAGEVASRMAVETVRDRMLQLQAHEIYGKMPFFERLRLSIEEANLLINGESQTNPAHKGLGATFTAVATQGPKIYFAQVGDSRAYILRQGRIMRVTKDQSLVQQLIDAGQITEEEAETHSYRNVILQALGAHNNVNVEVNCLTLCQLDTMVLCSDGLSGKVQQDEIASIVLESPDFKSACHTLINLANERGGEDNITVVIAQFSGNGLPRPDNNSSEPQSLARSPDTPTEINWGRGTETDQLSNSTGGAGTSDIDGHHKSTEPLPVPPSESEPFPWAKPSRKESESARTNDFSDRRGPITSVFAPEESDEEDEVLMGTQKTAGGSVTAPLENRSTRPLDSTPTESLTTQLPPTAAPAAANLLPADKVEKKTPVIVPTKKKKSPFNLFLIGGLLIIGVIGIVVGATFYFKQQATELEEQNQAAKQRLENINFKQSQISGLKEKISEIRKSLQALDNPAFEEKRERWEESLEKLSKDLDEVDRMDPDQIQQITQACENIDKELTKIGEDLKNLQGLLPSSLSDREPVKV